MAVGTDTVNDPVAVTRAVVATSDATYGLGGIKKSLALNVVPRGLVTRRRPVVVEVGTVAVKVVADADATKARLKWNCSRSFAKAASKFVPVMLTEVPTGPMVGENPVMDGAELAATVKVFVLAAVPPGAVTEIVPLVDPLATVATSCVVVAFVTVAVVPLKVTVFWLAVAEKPVPEMVTVVPIGPDIGENETIDTADDACRSMDRTLPTAS